MCVAGFHGVYVWWKFRGVHVYMCVCSESMEYRVNVCSGGEFSGVCVWWEFRGVCVWREFRVYTCDGNSGVCMYVCLWQELVV